jgi:hypothetical protein
VTDARGGPAVTVTPQAALAPQLATVKEEFLLARERARRLCHGMDDAGWSRRPASGGWSVGECITHLNITSEQFMPLLDDAIRRGRERDLTARGPFRLGLAGWALLRFLEPPYKMKSKTTPTFDPVHVEPMDETLERFDYLQQELQARVDRASGLALERLKLASPFSSYVKYNLYAAFCLIAAHQRRHLWQGEQTRA